MREASRKTKQNKNTAETLHRYTGSLVTDESPVVGYKGSILKRAQLHINNQLTAAFSFLQYTSHHCKKLQ